MKDARRPAFLAAFLLAATSAAWCLTPRFMTYPDIHGDRVVFTYEGDLWIAPVSGGTAVRVTDHPGVEYSARFSPDGKSVAFTASYDGQPAVYVMPADGGGPPKQVTWVPGGAQALGWTPDGGRIYFRSNVENFIFRDPNLYFVDKDGSAPRRFPTERGVLASFSPDGKRVLYCRKGNEEYQWKRYRGGQYQDIWMYDFESERFTPVSDFVGKNSYPMWVGDRMIFVSDRDGIANLYEQGIGKKEVRQLTHYKDSDVRMAETDGRRVVYLQDGDLWTLDLASGAQKKIEITLSSDRWRLRDRVINPKEYVHSASVADSGKVVAVEARGDVFAVPADKKAQTINLSRAPGTREMHPAISPDGKTVAFFSDKTGEYQLYTQPVTGGEWTALTSDMKSFPYRCAWSPDGTKVLFGNKEFAIQYVDVASKTLTKVDEWHQLKNDEFTWEIDDYGWSPDSRWVCYTKVAENRNSQVFLYGIEEKKATPVTGDFYDNLHPCFDQVGDYLFFLSSRNFDIRMDFYEDNHVVATPYNVVAIQLRAGEKQPFADQPEEIRDLAAPKPEKAADKSTGDDKAKKDDPKTVKIDLDGIQSRVFHLPVPAGNYFNLKAGKGKVMWCSVSEFSEDEYEEIFKPGSESKWTLHVFDLAKKEAVAAEDKIRDYGISPSGEQVLVQKGGDYWVTTADKLFQSKKPGEKISLDQLSYRVDSLAEWNQIFTDAWRWYRDFFYDAAMHGHDWKALGEKYRKSIPDLSSRDQLNWLLSQLVGELCVGHAYVGGGDVADATPPPTAAYTGCLGADVEPDPASGLYRFARVYGPTEYDFTLEAPLAKPDIQVKKGDYLLAIDGVALKVPQDYYRLLQVVKGQKVAVTVSGEPSMEKARTYYVEPLRSDRRLRYAAWIEGNIRKVAQMSNGRVGYMHITAMGAGGVGEFDKYWRAFRYKDAVIIDVRRNSGGWTEYFLINKLESRLVSYNVLRNMDPFRYPGGAGDGNYVVVTNEYNASDGECFVEHFKARKLGKVVGVPSWGGLVGILNAQATIDNGSVNQPNNGFYGREGKWWVENHGADPDILVDNDPQSMAEGRDLQLEKAVETALSQADQNKDPFPPTPAYPKR